jgi:hypothetical protein
MSCPSTVFTFIVNLNLDVFGQKIYNLVKAKDNAVDREDYMEADKLKQTINKIK